MAGRKKSKYTKEIPGLFMELCKKGNTLTQIASHFEITKEELFDWSKNKKHRRDFVKAWELGKQASQAFHEHTLDCMIHSKDPNNGEPKKYSSAEIEAQKYRLRVQFKEDWSDKQEAKLEISNLDRMSDQELQAEIIKKVQAHPGTRNFLQSLLNTTAETQIKVVDLESRRDGTKD